MDKELGTCCEPEASLAGSPPYRRLFLDAMVVEERRSLDRVFHAAEKYKGNPVVPFDREYEHFGPYIYGTVMWDEGKLKMWYQLITEAPGISNGYAESTDGIHWTKPDLGLVEYEGRPTNAVKGDSIGLPSVIKLFNHSSADARWAVYSYGKNGPQVGFSRDGLDWRFDEEHTKLFKSSDVLNFFYDPYKSRYVSTYKTANRRHRAVGIAFSNDGIKWNKPIDSAVFGADDFDPDAMQVYGMPVFPYQGCYIGLPWMYHSRWIKYGKYTSPDVMREAEQGSPRKVDVQLAWSWDLISWNRTSDREPFIANGPEGSWEYGQVYTARAPVIVGDDLYFYYGGADNLHGSEPDIRCAIGLAILRLDGFCSMRAGDEEGWLVSRREVFNTPKVRINAKCAVGGYVVAELVDRDNRPIRGFSRKDCLPFTGDSVRGEISWKTGQFPRKWIDKDKKIRFYMKNADLYSYLPENINQDIDDSWPDV